MLRNCLIYLYNINMNKWTLNKLIKYIIIIFTVNKLDEYYGNSNIIETKLYTHHCIIHNSHAHTPPNSPHPNHKNKIKYKPICIMHGPKPFEPKNTCVFSMKSLFCTWNFEFRVMKWSLFVSLLCFFFFFFSAISSFSPETK